MSNTIYCTKLKADLPSLDFAPLPGALGEKILNHISKPAWQQWLDHQTMLINEYRLNLLDAQAREFLIQEMEKFLFGGGAAKPVGYSEPQ